jgi:UMP-CMP kinase
VQSHYFVCFLQACVERCLGRGAAGSGRSDDNMQSLQKRFNTYITETQPIIKYYEERNLVRTIDANTSPDEVFEEVKKVFENFEAGGDF